MFRSVIRLAQSAAKVTRTVAIPRRNPVVFSVPSIRKYGTEEIVEIPPEELDAKWINYFEDPEMDTYSFVVGFMTLYGDDMVPEPKVIQSALYACRRLNNFPMAMRVLEMVKVKCDDREDIYDYLMQELKPTLDDLGLTTVEGMKLEQVED